MNELHKARLFLADRIDRYADFLDPSGISVEMDPKEAGRRSSAVMRAIDRFERAVERQVLDDLKAKGR